MLIVGGNIAVFRLLHSTPLQPRPHTMWQEPGVRSLF
jgi:hypothetical protein